MKVKIALIQMTSALDYKENLAKLDKFLVEAKDQKAEYAFFARVFLFYK